MKKARKSPSKKAANKKIAKRTTKKKVPAKKAIAVTATDQVLKVVKRFKKGVDVDHFGDIIEGVAEKVQFELDDRLLACGCEAVNESIMGQIRPDQDQHAVVEIREMVSYMSFSLSFVYVNEFHLRVKMPEGVGHLNFIVVLLHQYGAPKAWADLFETRLLVDHVCPVSHKSTD